MDRRRLLTLGGLTVGGVVGGSMLLPDREATSAPAPDGAVGHHGEYSPSPLALPGTSSRGPRITPFSTRMPVPRELRPVRTRNGTDVYEMAIEPANVEIVPGLPAAVRTFGGDFVGPTIRAKTGLPIRITYTNKLDRQANVHLHGGHVPQASDGYPTDVIAPGGRRTYDYPNTQQGATLWYHDHSHHTEAENVYFGMHGFYIVEDDAERSLNLPTGQYDVPIMLRDAEIDENGGLVFPSHPPDRTTILANGKPVPYFPVAARKYRFRLLNAANERQLRLTLGGAQIVQIASDGGLLPAPVVRTDLGLGSAERADIVVDFSRHAVGSQVVLYDVSGPVLRFDVVRTAADTSRVPARLRALPALRRATAERDITFRFDLSDPNGPVGLMNERAFDPSQVDFRVKRGTTEIWRIRNDDTEFGIPHTFHLHLEQFRVLDRDGAPPTLDDAGRKDTIMVAPGETVRIQATFTEFTGKYVYHCHFLEHSSLGMMAQMEIVP